jgi:hypothetical protein
LPSKRKVGEERVVRWRKDQIGEDAAFYRFDRRETCPGVDIPGRCDSNSRTRVTADRPGEASLTAESLKKSVPPAHFDWPQLASMTNVACAGAQASANPLARANGVKICSVVPVMSVSPLTNVARFPSKSLAIATTGLGRFYNRVNSLKQI